MKQSTNGFLFICQQNGLEFVEIVKERRNLEDNEYYALMVTENVLLAESNPHVICYDIITHDYLIGIERPNGNCGCYISKDFNSRHGYGRGKTMIVKTDEPEKFTLLKK